MAENCPQLSRALLLPSACSSLHLALRESICQGVMEPRVGFDPLGKQRKGQREEEAVDMVGQQTWEGSNRQESQSTMMPAQPSPVLSSPPTKGGPWLQGTGTCLH